MPVELKETLLGGLNMDDSFAMLPKNSYPYALNITHDAVEGSNDNAITNIRSNKFVSYN